jgi:hypothetical protein
MWRPTPPKYLPADDPEWGSISPWCLTSDSEFDPPPPPALDNATYINDHNQIYTLGALYNSTRTQEQSDIATFWYNGPASDTPPGTWQTVAEDYACAHSFDMAATARLFAMMSMALADAAIVAWRSKYLYNRWRPITAIRWANTTAPTTPPLAFDPIWLPLLTTPNWPDYISDRAMFGGVGSELMTRFFGDNVAFSIVADGLGVTRSFPSFAAAAFEQAQSRVFGGAHFNHSCMYGLWWGQKVADWSFSNCIPPRVSPAMTRLSAAASSSRTSVIVGSVLGALFALACVVGVIVVVVKHRASGFEFN